MRRAVAGPEAWTHDHRPVTLQGVRPPQGRRRHHLHGTDRSRDRLPGSQRGRQVHHDADDGRADPADRRQRHRPRAPVRGPAQPRHRGRGAPRRVRPPRGTHRPRDPHHRPAPHGPAVPAGPRDARAGQPDRHGGEPSRPQLLARHAATAPDRRGPDRSPAGADPRRARQRARPGGDPLDAGPAPRVRRPRRHRPAVLAPAARDRRHRRRHRGHRQRPDRGPGHQGRAAAGRRHGGPQPGRRTTRARPARLGPHRRHRRRRCPPHRRRPRAGRDDRPRRRRGPHRAAQRRQHRPRGDVPRAHRRHPTRRSSGMTALAVEEVRAPRTASRPIPFTRVAQVELRKMFDTRSGFWLMASVVIAAVSATGAVIAFAPDDELTYSTFSGAIGFPMAVILPMIAILSVTSEWSQRSGLTTFTMVPHRGRVISAKAISSVAVGAVSIPLAFAIGAVGNLVGTAITGTDLVWDVSLTDGLYIVLGNVLGLLVGFMLGVLIRNSSGAIVAYFVYSLLLPTISGLLAASQEWFRTLQPWVDFNYAQAVLFRLDGPRSAQEGAYLGVTGAVWLVLPLLVGLRLVTRSEVK